MPTSSATGAATPTWPSRSCARPARTQLGVARCVYALVAIVRKQVKSEASLFEILAVLSVSAFDKTPVATLFADAAPQSAGEDPEKHLCLWG